MTERSPNNSLSSTDDESDDSGVDHDDDAWHVSPFNPQRVHVGVVQRSDEEYGRIDERNYADEEPDTALEPARVTRHRLSPDGGYVAIA